jgi:hypothetical protein
MNKNKIVIKLSKTGRVRKVISDADIEVVVNAMNNVAKYPKKVRHSKGYSATKKIKSFGHRLHFIAIAVKEACSKDFAKEDIPRHQYPEIGGELVVSKNR